MEEASAMMVGLDPDRILQGLQHLQHQDITPRNLSSGPSRPYLVNLRLVSDYSKPNVSEKVVRIILSYTDYINRVVWRK